MATPVWISLGSNLGDRRAILDGALVALAETPGVIVRAVSSYHETQPVGGPPGQGPFLNAAAHLGTNLSPHELLAALQRIENEAGRVRTVRWGERALDLDILIYGTTVLDTKDLKLPHPKLVFRRFVLAPLAEIAPRALEPMSKRTISGLLAHLDRKPRLLAISGPAGPRKASVFRALVEAVPGFGIAEPDHESPVPDQGFETIPKNLERKAQALNAWRWAAEKLRVPWLVADYYLPELAQAALEGRRGLMPTRVALYLSGVALEPTLVVALAENGKWERGPGQGPVLWLWPESDEPDAIVAEVVATCRGIDGL